jgi:hypothetical protein
VSELDVLGRLPYGCIGVLVTLVSLPDYYQRPNGIEVVYQTHHEETERCDHEKKIK